MPVAPHAAVIPGKYMHYGTHYRINLTAVQRLTLFAAYTEVINLLDYTSVCIPVTHADKDIDVFDHCYKPLNDVDRENWQACMLLASTTTSWQT